MINTQADEARVRQVTPDALVRSSSMLGCVDYEDAFIVEVDAPDSRRAEEWMRVILEDAPASVRLRLLSAWSAIGLKVGLPGSDRSVLGWQIRAAESDFVLLGADSRIGSLYAKIGLTPDLSVSAQLALAVGQRRALQLVLQDRLLTAQEALDWGLVAEVVDGGDAAATADAVRARADEIARFWLANAPGAYGQAKRLVRSRPERSFADQLAEEARTIGEAFDTPDAQARIAGFAAASARRAQPQEDA